MNRHCDAADRALDIEPHTKIEFSSRRYLKLSTTSLLGSGGQVMSPIKIVLTLNPQETFQGYAEDLQIVSI